METRRQIRVAVVDDELEVRQSLIGMVQADPGLLCAGSHAEAGLALAQLPGQRPDVVLLDTFLPDLDGMEVLRQLRARGYGWKIILVTACTDWQLTWLAAKFGANGHLAKPLTPEDLSAAIRWVCVGGFALCRRVADLLGQSKPGAPPVESLAAFVRRAVFDPGPSHDGEALQDAVAHAARYSVSNLAARCGYTEDQFRAQFLRCWHQLPSSWLADRQMRYARGLRLLGFRVGEVADDMGLSFASSFSRKVRAYYHTTPRLLADSRPADACLRSTSPNDAAG